MLDKTPETVNKKFYKLDIFSFHQIYNPFSKSKGDQSDINVFVFDRKHTIPTGEKI